MRVRPNQDEYIGEEFDGGAIKGAIWALILTVIAIVVLVGVIWFISIVAETIMGAEAMAQEWYPANQLTMAWDAPIALQSGAPIPAGDTVEYDVFMADLAKTNVVQANGSRLTDTQFTFTFAEEGKFVLGVQAFRIDSGGQEIGESVVAWSDDPNYATNPFGAAFYIAIDAAGNLRRVEP